MRQPRIRNNNSSASAGARTAAFGLMMLLLLVSSVLAQAVKVVKSRRTLVWIACGFILHGLFAQTDRSTTNPEIDARLAAYFNVYSPIPKIEEQITDATKAGQRPKEVVIKKSWVEKFVDHSPDISRRTGIPPLVGTAVANSDLVVMATVERFHSLPIKDHSFLFTEYAVRVNRVFFWTNRVALRQGTRFWCPERAAALNSIMLSSKPWSRRSINSLFISPIYSRSKPYPGQELIGQQLLGPL